MTVAEALVIEKWRARKDTLTIANELGTEEAWVYRVIAAEQDRIHALKHRAAPGFTPAHPHPALEA